MADFTVRFSTDEPMRVNFDSGSLDMAAIFGDATVVRENDYERLINHPKIESVELVGDKSFAQLGLVTVTNSEIEAIFN